MRATTILATALAILVPHVAACPPPDAAGAGPFGGIGPAGLPLDDAPDPTRLGRSWAYAHLTTDLAGAEASGRILLEGHAVATRGYVIRYVGVWVDGWYVGQAEGTANWTFDLDTAPLPDGPHRLSVAAMAQPKLLAWSILSGNGDHASFRSLNHPPTVLLFEKTLDFTGADAQTWLLRLQEDHTGLRVTLRTEALPNGTLPAPKAQLVAAYKETEDDDRAPLRTWTATYGPLRGGATITRAPYPVMEAPGVISLVGAVAGEGRLHVKVEAVPHLGAT